MHVPFSLRFFLTTATLACTITTVEGRALYGDKSPPAHQHTERHDDAPSQRRLEALKTISYDTLCNNNHECKNGGDLAVAFRSLNYDDISSGNTTLHYIRSAHGTVREGAVDLSSDHTTTSTTTTWHISEVIDGDGAVYLKNADDGRYLSARDRSDYGKDGWDITTMPWADIWERFFLKTEDGGNTWIIQAVQWKNGGAYVCAENGYVDHVGQMRPCTKWEMLGDFWSTSVLYEYQTEEEDEDGLGCTEFAAEDTWCVDADMATDMSITDFPSFVSIVGGKNGKSGRSHCHETQLAAPHNLDDSQTCEERGYTQFKKIFEDYKGTSFTVWSEED